MADVTLTRLAPFFQSLPTIASCTAQARRLVAGTWTNVGSAEACSATTVPNQFASHVVVTLEADGSWDGVIRFTPNTAAPPMDVAINIPPTDLSAGYFLTLIAPYISNDVITGTPHARLKTVSAGGSISNVGAQTNAVDTTLVNGWGARITVPAASAPVYVLWTDPGTGLLVAEDLNTSRAAGSGGGGSGGCGGLLESLLC